MTPRLGRPLFAMCSGLLALALGCAGSGTEEAPVSRNVPVYSYQIVNVYPHDPEAFTEGLAFRDGCLYEGTGLKGASSLRKVELATGSLLKTLPLPSQYFGEGIALFGNRIVQLTWQDHQGFVYDADTFEPLGQFTYPTEGWGLTQDGSRLIMSDGTSRLHFLDPVTFQETGHVDVHDDTGPVTRLNELEFVRGEIYANIWQEDRIARIDPATGTLLGLIDLSGLLASQHVTDPVDVLNGIAFDPQGERLFVTGKLWPKLFEIRLVP